MWRDLTFQSYPHARAFRHKFSMSVSQENRGSLFPGNAWGVPIHCQLIVGKKLSVMPIVA